VSVPILEHSGTLIQPDVAFAMVQLGLSLEGTLTALNLEDGLALLHEAAAPWN